jgi:hypothetical protein
MEIGQHSEENDLIWPNRSIELMASINRCRKLTKYRDNVNWKALATRLPDDREQDRRVWSQTDCYSVNGLLQESKSMHPAQETRL